jgi:hypothetical protein
VRTKLAVLLSLLLSFAGAIYIDALDIRVDLDVIDQEEASAVNDLDDSLTSKRSTSIRNRRVGRNLSASSARGFYARLADSLSCREIIALSCSSHRKIYRLQEVFRI